MTTQETMELTTTAELNGGKFLTFELNGEEYGLSILQVQEIISPVPITRVPHTPAYMVGVMNLRGKVIPVYDLRRKFRLPPTEWAAETCIIVVKLSNLEVGMVGDRVCEVREIGSKDLDPAPSFGTSVDASFLKAMAKKDGKVTMILDLPVVLDLNELLSQTG